MCGLAGGYMPGDAGVQATLQDAVRRMCTQMRMRGPDARGFRDDAEAGISLGHQRLSIMDPEARANQPMRSRDGRYAIAYNGEIYNFRELRQEAERAGVRFQTGSDTEVLLELFAREGEALLPRLRGMYALAIWDTLTGSIFLARDPYGIKPLYLARAGRGWLFASQVKALLASGLVAATPDAAGQAGFWLLGSVPEPRTWFRDISLLPAGHCVWITAAGLQASRCYRDIGEAWRHASGADVDDEEVRARAREALLDSVRAHLVSDVPVGVFLSGGIDSGSMAALMRQAGAVDLKGVTVAFREFAGSHDDEVPVAARLALRYGIDHHVREVGRGEFEADLPRILASMDQPSVDGINSWYASKAVAELGMKVVVSGVGGDELFQGYSSFHELPTLVRRWRSLARIPGFAPLARKAMTLQARRTGNPRWRLLPELAGSLHGAWLLRRGVASPHELPELMGRDLAAEVLEEFDGAGMVRSMTGPVPADDRLALSQIESMTYLRNQLLRDSDWASMAHSVELRTPLVDATLLADLQPVLMALHRFPGKRLLAEAPRLPLEEAVIVRRKTGFGTPVTAWLEPRGLASDAERPGLRLARSVAEECYRA
jgi:asparagine synthase (glutamine-hydrolysing)